MALWGPYIYNLSQKPCSDYNNSLQINCLYNNITHCKGQL